MPGSQLVNRLQDLHYRVLTVSNPALLAATTKRETPLLVFVDLEARGDLVGAIAKIRAEAATSHVPIIAFAADNNPGLLATAQTAGANLTVSDSALTSHLETLLEQALHLD